MKCGAGEGTVGNRPRQFVVARLRAPDPIGFPKRRPIGGVRGSLMSDRQQKSYWVGREAHRELARNQCFIVREVAETVSATRSAT